MGRLYFKSITATALLFIFVALFPQRVNSFSVFELDLVSLENSDDREFSGGCCSGFRSADGSCPGNCSAYLHFCFSHYQTVVDLKSSCTFFEFRTPAFTKDTNSSYNVHPQQRMSLDLEFAWPGAFSVVVSAWHPSEGNGYRDLIDRFVAQRTLEVNPEWKNDTLMTSRSSLIIKYRVVCQEHYYGDKCEKLCRDRNDIYGHFTCSTKGERICRPGWANKENDTYCLKPMCRPLCKNGHCIEKSTTSQECRCLNGWNGTACDICVKSEGCKHGKCETDPNQCLCDEGWGGLFCEQDLNFCTNHKPCQNGGTCTNTAPGSFTCKCPDGFIGNRCEIFKNPCRLNPCENGATCKNPSDGQYICECASNFFGPLCDTWANICNDNLCINGGTCIQDPNGFICSCPLGYQGLLCEKIDSTNCQVYPCLNGGTCINSSNGFNCMCSEGITGSRCEETIHCSSYSCENGGTCTEQNGNITCVCPSGFSGTHCQNDHNRCSSNPCANGATCYNLLDSDTGYNCKCAPGFTGPHCNIHDHCSSSPCHNGATCHVIGNGYLCRCLVGYSGDRCQLIVDWNGLASNVSHRISREEAALGTKEVALICALALSLLLILILICCIVRCVLRRRHRHRQREVEVLPQKAKEYAFDMEEERLQNERNAMHMNLNMNNKQCDNVPRKIVNELDRVPAKHVNEAPPKVLNKEVGNKRIPDKALEVLPRTFKKMDNMCGSSISCHSPQDCSPFNSGGIYVIEDHLQSPNDSGGSTQQKKDILATEV